MSITNNSTFSTIVGIICMLVMTLIFGSYTYTWSGLEGEQKEKREWRDKHQEQLNKKFDEVRQGQDKIAESVNKNNDDVKDLLKQMLDEQKRSNQLRSQQRRNP